MNKVFIVFLAILGVLASSQIMAQRATLSIEQFEKRILGKGVQILDVRTAGEFQGGFLKNAMQANWNDPEEFLKRTGALDKARPVYVYCLSGARSNAAANWLNERGYQAYNLSGGMMAWKKAGKPIEQLIPVIAMTSDEYSRLINSGKTVLVDFGAGWCPPCIKMAPILDSLLKANPGKFSLVKIDGSSQTALASRMNITAFPVFIIYKNGKQTWRAEGIVQASEIIKAM